MEKIKNRLGEKIKTIGRCGEIPVLSVSPEDARETLSVLKNEFSFELLTDLTAADYPEREERFEVVYILYSFADNRRIMLKAGLRGDAPEIPSVAGLWKSADWLEREIYDMFGIKFSGHPNLKRILMYDSFRGHPLRKDYPLDGKQPRIKYRNGKD